jgi:hypothetical protein
MISFSHALVIIFARRRNFGERKDARLHEKKGTKKRQQDIYKGGKEEKLQSVTRSQTPIHLFIQSIGDS